MSQRPEAQQGWLLRRMGIERACREEAPESKGSFLVAGKMEGMQAQDPLQSPGDPEVGALSAQV